LKEQANAITLRSGMQLEQEQPRNINAESSGEAKERNKDEQRKAEDSRNNRRRIRRLNDLSTIQKMSQS